MKTKRVLTILTVMLLTLGMIASPSYALDDNIQEQEPIVYETEQVLYLDEETGEFVENKDSISQQRGTLFEIVVKHKWIVAVDRTIDLHIKLEAKNKKARIRSIYGKHTIKDQNSYASNTIAIEQHSNFPNYLLGCFVDGTKSFKKGNKVKCTASYYISLVEGEVLNGGRITQTMTLKIV